MEHYVSGQNSTTYTFTNNRDTQTTSFSDLEGNLFADDYASSTYNAAGQMVRSVRSQTDAVRYYDGNGREIKRQTANFVETQNSSNWIQQPNKYYIRSSVLGGETVSEVWANGKKGKTFVRAAGAQIAYQSAYGSETSTLYETVFFEYSDASGMSQRTTDKTGAAVATGDGGEGSPAELDPLGSNVGTSTPYIELLPPYEPSPDYPMLQSYFDDAPNYVNGQRQTCTLDGFAISCSRAFSMLETGSAIPAALAQYQHLPGFQFNSNGLGLFTVNIPLQVGWQVHNSGGPNEHVTPIYSQFSFRTFSFSLPFTNISWSPPRQTQVGNTPLIPRDQKRFESERNKALNKGVSEKCADFLEKLGTSAAAVLNAIREQVGFDGPKSTITNRDAGTYDADTPSDYPGLDRTVSSEFKIVGRLNAMAGTSGNAYYRGSSKFLGIFRVWGGLNASTIFHEAVHQATNLGDQRLIEKAGVSQKEGENASDALQRGFRENDCPR